ncbi:glucose 1-dehydrogenase [Roseibacillus persicicus]|uniref:Glucose-1-dehydrogenase n=1 Tax=Roseibacillus persicicus TaxID=454148 RepID=A0A918WLX4_9BACT|nr:glucose 1-dehydrogenase [Roseibacillus persicicus]MDQ8189449.1 glucose 1-dehydrogenase [Roseibacillus persicicus]GHC55290.1 glucose-1-dehydrogenase [Roseibacillus persicicus]
MKIDLSNKCAFVTGSSSGIGQAVALSLAQAGARVAVHYRSNEAGAKETARRIQEINGPPPLILQGDVSKPADIAKCFTELDKQFPSLDIFVNNAGIDGKKCPLSEIDFTEFEKVVAINLTGGARAIQAALRRMKTQQSGVILSVTSVHESVPWAGQAAYCASKAGIAILTRSLALELGDCGIRVLNLAPGAIQTAINQDVWKDPDSLEDLLQKIPQGRLGTADEIGRMATFLVSDAASYLTGTTIFADGGMTAYPSFAQGG